MKKINSISVMLILMILINSFAAYADESVQFQLVESTPAHLASEVDLNSEIKLLFNKNVVNFAVKENNIKCITMYDENNQTVLVELIFPDDQIEPEKKREIYVKPVEELIENTSYTIKLSSDLMAKNGSTLGEDVNITFKTITVNIQEEPIQAISPEIENQEIVTEENEKVTDTIMENNISEPETNIETEIPELSSETEINEEAPVYEVSKETKSEIENDIENSTIRKNINFNFIIGAITFVVIISYILIILKKRRA